MKNYKDYKIEEFDNFIREKFNNFEITPPDDTFVKIINTIKTKYLWKYLILGSFVVASIAAILIKINESKVSVMPLIAHYKEFRLNNIFFNFQSDLVKNNEPYSKIDIHKNTKVNLNHSIYRESTITEKNDYPENTEHQMNNTNNFYDYRVYTKPNVCNSKNGGIYITCSNCNDIEFILNNEIIQGKKENIASGFYKIYVKKGTRIIDTLSAFVKDSLKLSTNFNIFELPDNNFLTVYLENTSTIDRKPWSNYSNLSFSWYINNQKISDESNVVYQFVQNGTYNIKLVSNYQNVCKDSVLKKYVVSIPVSYDKIQNIFTPNNDGINDYFEPELKGLKIEECNIFDRNGILVYSVKHETIKWDGKILNTNTVAPDGVYYYVIRATNANNKTVDMKGMIYLKR
ncbi:MAG: gliding motility-associated C-terminal domain-containing protein [Bacteroidales bacterium]|nr:gliding motility-associated C-terminal domain-containing protein [Bacteroidales bacterium]